MLKSRRKRNSKVLRFQSPAEGLTPLIDTAFTLLLVFMISFPAVQHAIKVGLAKSQTKEIQKPQQYVVTITAEKELYFNENRVEKDKLYEYAKEIAEKNSDLQVYIRADQTISYGTVVGMIDVLKLAGISNVAMATE